MVLQPAAPCSASKACYGKILTPKGSGSSAFMVPLIKSHKVSSLDWLPFLPIVLSRHSMFLASPVSWCCHRTVSFTLRSSQTALPGHTARFSTASFETRWKPLHCHSLYILYIYKTGKPWLITVHATSLNNGPWFHWLLNGDSTHTWKPYFLLC